MRGALASGFLTVLFCSVAAYAAVYASDEYRSLSNSFLVYAAAAMIIWTVYAWQPAFWAGMPCLVRPHFEVGCKRHSLMAPIMSVSPALVCVIL